MKTNLKKKKLPIRTLAITLALALVSPMLSGVTAAWAVDSNPQIPRTETIDLTGYGTFIAAVEAASITPPLTDITAFVIIGQTTSGQWNNYDSDYLMNYFPNATTLDMSGYSGTFAAYAFNSNLSITTVKLPMNVAISIRMFQHCTNLNTLAVGSGVLEPGVVNLSGTASYGTAAFDSCTSITTVKLAAGVALSGSLFASCSNLKTMAAGNVEPTLGVVDLSSLGAAYNSGVFSSCTSIKAVRLATGVPLPTSIFSNCSGLDSLIVGGSALESGVVNLSGLEASYDAAAFNRCASITAVKLPVGFAVPQSAFIECTCLNTLVVGNGALQPSLVDLSGLTASYGSSAFYGCTSITAVRLPAGVAMPQSAFEYCTKLDTLVAGSGTLQPGVVDLSGFTAAYGNGTFASCISIATVKLPANVTLSSSLFYNCTGLDTLVVGSGVPTPGVVDLSGFTAAYGTSSFGGCTSIKVVKLAAGRAVSNSLFYFCTSLNTLYLNGTAAPSVGTSAFSGVSIAGTIYYPAGMTGVGTGSVSGDFGYNTIIGSWQRLSGDPGIDLGPAKAAKVVLITAVLDGLVETDYTATSWAALGIAITDALDSVAAATTLTEIENVVVPDALSILVLLPSQPEGVCSIGSEVFFTLEDALAAVADGETITLLSDIDYLKPIIISDGRSITFATNGYTLNVNSTAEIAIYVSRGAIDLDDSLGGALNAYAPAENGMAAYARNAGSSLTVSNASGGYMGAYTVAGTVLVKGDAASTVSGYGANSTFAGSITVLGNATSTSSHGALCMHPGSILVVEGDAISTADGVFGSGAFTNYGGSIIVKGNAIGHYATYAIGANSTIQVEGNAIGSISTGTYYGAYADDGGQVNIQGNASGMIGAYANNAGSLVTVEGDVSGTSIGAQALRGAHIVVSGELSVAEGGTYIDVNTVAKNPSDGIALTSKLGYLAYANGPCVVWVKDLCGETPVEPSVTQLELRGSYPTLYTVGDDLDVTGMVVYTCTNDGVVSIVALDDPGLVFSGYDKNTAGQQTITVSYQNGSITYQVEVLPGAAKLMIVQTGIEYNDLADALAAAQSGDTIRLLQDIDYTQGITISGISLTFDLNGFILDVTVDSGVALAVRDGGELLLLGTESGGALNVTSKSGYGVGVTGNSSATVTNATGSGVGYAAVYAGQSSAITVLGDAKNMVTTVTSYGVLAFQDSVITVLGNVCGGSYGVAVFTATVSVSGNVFGNHCGVYTYNGGSVTIDGELTTNNFYVHVSIVDGGHVFSKNQYYPTTSKPGYLQYGIYSSSGIVWIRDVDGLALAAAKASKTVQINTVVTGLNELEYTAESWAALQIAIQTVLAEVDAATTVSEVEAVVVPDALSILVLRPAYGDPGSGDLNGDGIVDMAEALLIAQVVVGGGMTLSTGQFEAVDMDGDGLLTMADVVLIMRRAAGLS